MNQILKQKKPVLRKMKVHPNEEWLIKLWREKYRFGEFTVVMHDGIPQRTKLNVAMEAPSPLKK